MTLSLTALPALFGLPVGVSFIGPAWSEKRLLGFGYAFEQEIGFRPRPGFAAVPKVDALEKPAAK